MTKLDEFIGRIVRVRRCDAPTNMGVYYSLPSGLIEGQLVRMVSWVTAPDGHCTLWTVSRVDAHGNDLRQHVEGVWQRHLDVTGTKKSEPRRVSPSSSAVVIGARRAAEPAAPAIVPPFPRAREFIERVRAVAGQPERNMEDAVKELLVRLGHDPKRIVFQVGRIDVAVQDQGGRVSMVIEVKRSLASAASRDDALRKGFDYATRNGARFVVISDADRYEIYDRTRGLDHASMLCGSFRLTEFHDSDTATLGLLRPR